MNCPVCHIPLLKMYGIYGLYYECKNFKKCDMKIRSDKNGKPLGFPVRQRVRDLRSLVHEKLERRFNPKTKEEKNEMYLWVKSKNKKGHIGRMDYGELKKLLQQIDQLHEKTLAKFIKKLRFGTPPPSVKKWNRVYDPITDHWKKIPIGTTNYEQPTLSNLKHD